MVHTRRTYLRLLGGTTVIGSLAGCVDGAPATDGGSDEETDSDTETSTPDRNGPPGDDSGTDSGAGGTRPEGTGGPGITLVSVDDPPELPVEPSVTVTRDTSTADHPPQLRTTLTNTTGSSVLVGEGRAVHFAFVGDEDGQLILLPAADEREYPAEPDCWRLTEPLAITTEYRILEVPSDEPSSRLVDLYGAAGEDACLPVGEYRFETTLSIVDEGGDQKESARWGFTVLLE